VVIILIHAVVRRFIRVLAVSYVHAWGSVSQLFRKERSTATKWLSITLQAVWSHVLQMNPP